MVQDHPTVLVAVRGTELRNALVQSLRQDGYLVLEAAGTSDALYLARTHSRPIQVMLIDVSMKDELKPAVKPYRPHTKILLLAEHSEECPQEVVTPETVLGKIREFFKP